MRLLSDIAARRHTVEALPVVAVLEQVNILRTSEAAETHRPIGIRRGGTALAVELRHSTCQRIAILIPHYHIDSTAGDDHQIITAWRRISCIAGQLIEIVIELGDLAEDDAIVTGTPDTVRTRIFRRLRHQLISAVEMSQ